MGASTEWTCRGKRTPFGLDPVRVVGGAGVEKCGAQRVVLIASSLSMPRVGALAATTGVPVVLAPSPLDEPPVSGGFRLGIPSYRALRLTRDALYEHLALAYYRRSRWIR